MRDIIENVVKKLSKRPTFTEIKTELKSECSKASFPITDEDWNYMLDSIICAL